MLVRSGERFGGNLTLMFPIRLAMEDAKSMEIAAMMLVTKKSVPRTPS
jgi:hypothetical protein